MNWLSPQVFLPWEFPASQRWSRQAAGTGHPGVHSPVLPAQPILAPDRSLETWVCSGLSPHVFPGWNPGTCCLAQLLGRAGLLSVPLRLTFCPGGLSSCQTPDNNFNPLRPGQHLWVTQPTTCQPPDHLGQDKVKQRASPAQTKKQRRLHRGTSPSHPQGVRGDLKGRGCTRICNPIWKGKEKGVSVEQMWPDVVGPGWV